MGPSFEPRYRPEISTEELLLLAQSPPRGPQGPCKTASLNSRQNPRYRPLTPGLVKPFNPYAAVGSRRAERRPRRVDRPGGGPQAWEAPRTAGPTRRPNSKKIALTENDVTVGV